MGMLSLYLLRHGETEFSRQERFCGRIDAPLTPGGREMAARFAAAYGALDWRAILTSTRTRAIESATPLALRTGLVVEADDRLDEMFYGEWQGLSKQEVAARDGDYFARWERDPSIGPPQGESPRAVSARARAVIQDLLAQHAEGPVLIVSHKALLRILLCELFGIDLRHYRRGAWPVGAVTQIDLGVGAPVMRRFADVEHLTSPGASEETAPSLSAASV
jgi:broad specificity phosphatase PhoE